MNRCHFGVAHRAHRLVSEILVRFGLKTGWQLGTKYVRCRVGHAKNIVARSLYGMPVSSSAFLAQLSAVQLHRLQSDRFHLIGKL